MPVPKHVGCALKNGSKTTDSDKGQSSNQGTMFRSSSDPSAQTSANSLNSSAIGVEVIEQEDPLDLTSLEYGYNHSSPPSPSLSSEHEAVSPRSVSKSSAVTSQQQSIAATTPPTQNTSPAAPPIPVDQALNIATVEHGNIK